MTEALVAATKDGFQNPDGSGFNYANGQPIAVVNPATGSTVKMTAGQRDLYVANSATLAALTIQLPGGAADGDTVQLAFEGAVTALTIEDTFGNAVSGAATAGAANAAQVYRFVVGRNVLTAPVWVHWK